jgi:hypothetical protein
MSQVLPCLLRVARVHTAACNTQLPCAISCKYLDNQLEQVAALPPVEPQRLLLEQEQLLLQQQQQYRCQLDSVGSASSSDC